MDDPLEIVGSFSRRTKRWLLVILAALVCLIIVWFQWRSYDAKRAELVENKVENALNAAIESQLRSGGDRVEFLINGGQPFYSPMLDHSDQTAAVYQQTLMLLNQDSSMPPIRLDNLLMMTSESVGASVTIEYTGAFGTPKSMRIHVTHRLIPFKHPEGPETY